ncbi:MAG: replication-associated recombination protein A [Acidimicrobiia bacterium]
MPTSRTGKMDDLFAAHREARQREIAPLATRMRPRALDEIAGQAHLVAPGAAFRTMVEAGRPVSMILWGPPGTGKTTLARLVAAQSEAQFEQLSATSAGVKDVRDVLAGARRRLGEEDRRTVLFLDEIHRFSKSQQDALLSGVEDGTLVLVGATTENPFFEVNSPLISRSTLFRLERLEPAQVADLLDRALTDSERGLGALNLTMDDDARIALTERCGGDARLALNALEMAALLARPSGNQITFAHIEEALQRRIVRYDKAGDQHYDVISAFIKSMRGSDPDAALYWLHTMLEAGEDPEFIIRRMIVFASEDVGLADSGALAVAVAAGQALAYVGLPEASYALSQAALYLATAPKSDSVKSAMGSAHQAVADTPGAEVPIQLRQAGYQGAAVLGHGEGYRYPHDHPGHIVRQQYLPEAAEGTILFRPTGQGDEAELAERLKAYDEILGKPPRD